MNKHKENKHYLTEEQFQSLDRYARMVELNANLIQKLCSSEKSDIEYGFVLGKMHTHLRDCFIEMMKLVSDIRTKNTGVKS